MKLTDLLSKNHALIQWQREQNKITRTLFTGIRAPSKHF
jgi:transcription-repair coupling factor (superfamily II helicase)